MYIETWQRINCPACKAVNWICQGDLGDMTYFNSDELQCWKCKKIYNYDGDILDTDYYEQTLERPN